MIEISLSEEILSRAKEIVLSCIECTVNVQPKNELLWGEIAQKIEKIRASVKTEEISKMPAIAASRKAYKACGKDPARYRLSAEALLRRVVKRGEIYQVNNVVDVLNLVSISTGFSIGGYDVDRIRGKVHFGIGRENEPYEGIGRGGLNISHMPVFRDDIGAFGTPTSDSVRTSVNENTQRFLMVIIDYGTSGLLNRATEMAQELLKEYTGATQFEVKTIQT